MSTSYDDWKTAAPDLHEPDPAPDTETYPELVERVKEALYQACEEGSRDYTGKHSRLLDLIEVCRWILTNDDIRQCCETGQYTGAADDIAFKLDRQFGADFRRQLVARGPATFFVDRNLAALVTWLQKRERPQ